MSTTTTKVVTHELFKDFDFDPKSVRCHHENKDASAACELTTVNLTYSSVGLLSWLSRSTDMPYFPMAPLLSLRFVLSIFAELILNQDKRVYERVFASYVDELSRLISWSCKGKWVLSLDDKSSSQRLQITFHESEGSKIECISMPVKSAITSVAEPAETKRSTSDLKLVKDSIPSEKQTDREFKEASLRFKQFELITDRFYHIRYEGSALNKFVRENPEQKHTVVRCDMDKLPKETHEWLEPDTDVYSRGLWKFVLVADKLYTSDKFKLEDGYKEFVKHLNIIAQALVWKVEGRATIEFLDRNAYPEGVGISATQYDLVHRDLIVTFSSEPIGCKVEIEWQFINGLIVKGKSNSDHYDNQLDSSKKRKIDLRPSGSE
jgi:hypothetical protein